MALEETLEGGSPERRFDPNMATVAAWDAQAHMLAYRHAAHGSAHAETERVQAQEAFAVVVEYTKDALLGTILSRTNGNIYAAEDILQETYIRAFKGLPRFKGQSQVQTWLTSIAFNQLSTYYKKEAKYISRHRRQASENADYDDGDFDEHPGFRGPALKLVAPERDESQVLAGIYHDEIAARLDEAIAQLSPKLGTTVVLHYFRGLDFEQIAEELGTTTGNVKVRLTRARQALSHVPVLKNLFDKIS